MRTCIIGQHFGDLNEGMRNITYYITKSLSEKYEVFSLYQRDIIKIRHIKNLINFNPSIFHYLHGPSLESFILLKFLSIIVPHSKTMITASQPKISRIFKFLITILKPDLILVQSEESEKFFRNLGCKVDFLPNGVDLDKFKPVSEKQKALLRENYGLPKDKFIVLHIGTLRASRNIMIFETLQKMDEVQVVFVDSMHIPKDAHLTANLVSDGVIIIEQFISNIEELYQLSDCYIFPTYDDFGAIEFPLTVLEAMACNIPVVTTKFKALPYFLSPGDGLYFYNNEHQLIQYMNEIKSGISVNLRDKAAPFSWQNVTSKLKTIYSELLCPSLKE